MQNKLITALLAFTALTSLAQQPSNAELLATLKKSKATTIRIAEESYSNLTSQYSEVDLAFVSAIINEFYNSSQTLQQLMIHSFEHSFGILPKANDLDEFAQEIDTLNNLFDESREELFTQFEFIYNKHHHDYCKNNSNGKFSQAKASEVFDDALQLIFDFGGSINTKNNIALKIIDAKIAELEAQA